MLFECIQLAHTWCPSRGVYTEFQLARSRASGDVHRCPKTKTIPAASCGCFSFFPTVTGSFLCFPATNLVLIILAIHILGFISLISPIQSLQFNHHHCNPIPIIHRPPRSTSSPAGIPRKPGPKSGPNWPGTLKLGFLNRFLRLTYLVLMTTSPANYGGEGCLMLSCHETGADLNEQLLASFFQAKHHDQAPQSGFGHHPCPIQRPLRQVHKRSFRRAFHRACQTGCAWYHGRCLTQKDFPPSSFGSPAPARPKPPSRHVNRPHPQHCHAPRYRMQVVHLNVGRLSQDRLLEIKQWAQSIAADVQILSETRWSFC